MPHLRDGRRRFLFQEADNRETSTFFRDRQECVYYDERNLVPLLEHYLEQTSERLAIVSAARKRIDEFTFANFWRDHLIQIQSRWPSIQARAQTRIEAAKPISLNARVWQALGSTLPLTDSNLVEHLEHASSDNPSSADLQNSLAIATYGAVARQDGGMQGIGEAFVRASRTKDAHLIANLNLAEALAKAGKREAAIHEAHRALHLLERESYPTSDDKTRSISGMETKPDYWMPHFPHGYDFFRVEWERAAWENAGDREGEIRAKRNLIRWRIHHLLAEQSKELRHYYETVLARPDLPTTRAALGCALARAGQPALAIPHLRNAVSQNPFDLAAARAIFQALKDSGDHLAQQKLVKERRLLAKAAPRCVPIEAWFDRPMARSAEVIEVRDQALHDQPIRSESAGRQLPVSRLPVNKASITASPTSRTAAPKPRPFLSVCLIVKNEEDNLTECLQSIDGVANELIVVDTGSQDRTKEIAKKFGANVFDFPWVDSFAAARNECLRHATGEWIFWLDADDRLDAENRERLCEVVDGLRTSQAAAHAKQSAPFDAYVMTCRCLSGREDGTITEVQHVRLFRNHPKLRWEHRIHEQILPAIRRLGGVPRFTDVVVEHVGYQDPNLRVRKRERDLRLLQIEHAERPDHPFTLFNLGMTYLDLKRAAEALPLLQRSLDRSAPSDSIVRKLYYMIVQCYRQMDKKDEALMACRKGREVYPQDAELLAQEGLLLNDRNDLAGAEQCYLQLLNDRESPHFSSVPVGLNGYLTRHNLAVVYMRQNKPADAETQWRAALEEKPAFDSAWLGLEDLYIGQSRWDDLEALAITLEQQPTLKNQALIARARGHFARREFEIARKILNDLIKREPRTLRPRVLLSHILLKENRDPVAAEQALTDILTLDPGNPEAKQNLRVLKAVTAEH